MDIDFARSYTIALNGLEANKVIVQAHIAGGLPAFNIVGLGDKAVSESKERIRAALSSIALGLPAKRITINLAPANLVKEGSHYDLPITLTILAALKLIPKKKLEDYLICGELSLDAGLNKTTGILSAAILATKLNKGLICSSNNIREAALSGNKNIASFKKLIEVINFLKDESSCITPYSFPLKAKAEQYNDFKDIKGLKEAKRAFEIAAVGRHNLLMIGPPGSGKSMLASSLPSILPELSSKELLESALIKSVTGDVNETASNFFSIPYRAPHHNTSTSALTGGGQKITAGEITRAHNGILFLDELPEFRRDVLEALRQPMETNKITIARAGRNITYPANFQLISAMNPCKCGYLQIPEKRCSKAPICSQEYNKKISGPLLERIDLIINIPYKKASLFNDHKIAEEDSKTIKNRVIEARQRQETSLKALQLKYSSELTLENFENHLKISEIAKQTLQKASDKYQLSLRNNLRILRVAKTISDLDAKPAIDNEHILEALSFKTEF